MPRLIKVNYFTAELTAEQLNTEDAAAIKAAAVFQARANNPKWDHRPSRYLVVWVKGNADSLIVRLRRESWEKDDVRNGG